MKWTVVVVILLSLLLPAVGRAAAPPIKGDQQAASEVQAAMEKFLAARSWRTRMTSGGATTTTEYVAPDRFHMTISEGSRSTEMFLVGRQTWIRTASGCTKAPFAVPVMNPKEIMEHGAADTTITVSRGGAETVEGTPTRTYMLVVESKGTTTREKLYVATTTGLPRRIEMQTERGAVAIDYLDFNAPIVINDPPC